MASYDHDPDDDIIGPDQEDCPDYDYDIKNRNRLEHCPNCKEQISLDMDSCPFCGDILFRHLKDGTFVIKSKILRYLLLLFIVIAILFIVWKLVF